MEILISFTAKIVEYTVVPIGRQLCYLPYYNTNIKNLTNQVEMLKESRESVQNSVDDARRNAEDIEVGVQNWLSKVDKIIEESVMILAHEDQENMKCSNGLCLNIVQRHQLSRKAKKMAVEIIEMRSRGNFEKVSYHGALSGVGISSLKTGFRHFESRMSTMEQIVNALLDPDDNMIGVYGMGGVGKTMLVKEISRLVKEAKLFDEVIMSTLSQTPDLIHIQGQLGDILGLKFEQETIEGRAIKLHKRLKMEKKILIVLDDIWKGIELETIGIPCGMEHGGCKILFTSRDKFTLSNDMGINKIFELKTLREDESWDFFENLIGEVSEVSNVKPIAIQIVKECAQLPIAIATVAKALRDKPLSIWRDALNQLRNPIAINIKGMNEKVYSSLALSYRHLECKEAQSLFLLCSMFPEDSYISVERLRIYAVGMGFLCSVDTLAKARDRVKKLVDDLISSCLLLASEWGDDYVHMHDVVRDVAILIASKDDQICTLSYARGLIEWREENMSGNYTVVCIDFNGFHKLPQKLLLPKAQLLRLSGERTDKLKLSRAFFEEMSELKVVELRELNFSLSPSLLHSFANLRSLCLLNCELESMDMIGELKKLEIVSFRSSNIREIPTGIGELLQLKVLDLSYCLQLKVIPPNILSRLTNLEELNLETSFVKWEGEELNRQGNSANLSELKHLTRLSTLYFGIEDEKILQKQLFPGELNLERFKITIGKRWHYAPRKTSRMLDLRMESSNQLDDWIKVLVKNSEELHLESESVRAKDLLFESDETSFPHLRHLHLYDNSEVQHFIQVNKPVGKAFRILESLSLSKLRSLENIIHGDSMEFPFNKLRFIKVEECDRLRNGFVMSIMNGLSNLERMEFSCCKMVEVIVVAESGEATKRIEFTQLSSLKLNCLPRLKSFCSQMEILGQSSYNSVDDGEDKFTNYSPLFSERVSFPNLEDLTITNMENLKIIYHDTLIADSFSKVVKVEIGHCKSIVKVFPSNMMSILKCLAHLKLKSCDLLEAIFEVQDPNATEKCNLLLPRLSSLELFDLPNLKYVWSKDPQELLVFENMIDLSVCQCPKLKIVYPAKVLRHLKKLEINLCSGLKEILGKEKSSNVVEMHLLESSKMEITELWNGPGLFSNLKILKLFGSLDHQCTHLPIEFAQILHNLEQLEVSETFFEEIFPSVRHVNGKEDQNKGCESLRNLQLFKLPKLRHLLKESSQENTSLLQNLQELHINRCGGLNFLVPSSVSFRNLSELFVNNCNKLTHLLNPPVAKSLVQLFSLYLQRCQKMITVIAEGEGAEENDEIVFSKLNNIALHGFNRLTSFHSGKCVIRFPKLDSLEISECPEMKLFSLGITSTPCLRRTSISNGNRYIAPNDTGDFIVNDINVVIRQLWEDHYDFNIQHLFSEQASIA